MFKRLPLYFLSIITLVIVSSSLAHGSAISSSNASASLEDTNQSIKKIKGLPIYTASLTLPTGEIAYFGIERITNTDRKNRWSYYATNTRDCFSASFFSTENLVNIVTKYFTDEDFAKSFEELVEGEEETHVARREKMLRVLGGCESGVRGMCCEKENYITYISKKPITGFCNLPESNTQTISLDEYILKYDHIIMSVSVFGIDDGYCDNLIEQYYQHCGIFRNPMSMLRNDYPGVSLLLHAFPALVFPEHYKYMIVNPNDNYKMIELLMKAFDENDMSPGIFAIPDNLAAKFPKKGKNDHAHACGTTSHIVIKTEALKRFFLARQQAKQQANAPTP
ncbi:MAG: hypothetical protein WCJ92_07910 [Alphaproteobacteria bacterium]